MAAGHGEGRGRRRQPLAERPGHGRSGPTGPERPRGAAAPGSIARSAARTPHTAGTPSAAAGHGQELTGSALPFFNGLDADWLSRCSGCASHWFLSSGGGPGSRIVAVTGCWGSGRRERRSAFEGGRVVWRLGLVPVPRPRCRSLIGALGAGPAPRSPRPAAPEALPGRSRCLWRGNPGDNAAVRPRAEASCEESGHRSPPSCRPCGLHCIWEKIQAAHPSPEPRDKAGRLKSWNGSNFFKMCTKRSAFPSSAFYARFPLCLDFPQKRYPEWNPVSYTITWQTFLTKSRTRQPKETDLPASRIPVLLSVIFCVNSRNYSE